MSRFLPSFTSDTYPFLLLSLASSGRLPFLLLLLYISFVYYAYTLYTRRSRVDMAKIPAQKHGHHHHHKPHGHGPPKPYRRGLSVADRSIVLGYVFYLCSTELLRRTDDLSAPPAPRLVPENSPASSKRASASPIAVV